MQSNNRQGTDELNGIQKQIDQRTVESLESTRRMVGLVAVSQEIGTNTMITLDEQGEQLNRIEVNFFFLSENNLINKFRMVLIIFMSEWMKLKKI